MAKARVGSTEALAAFKPSVIRFAEQSQAALGAAEHAAHRTLAWLVHERKPQLAITIRKLEEERARLRSRIALSTDPNDGKPRPKVDDQLALEQVNRKLRQAQEQLAAIRTHARQLERALEEYKGSVAQLGFFVRHDLANAVGALEAMGDALEAYAQVGTPRQASTQAATPEDARDEPSPEEPSP